MTPRYYKSIKLPLNDKIYVEYGVVNREKPNVLFINFKTYITTLTINKKLPKTIESKLNRFNKNIYNILSPTKFNNNFIFDFILAQDLDCNFKNKLLVFELFVKQNSPTIHSIIDLKKDITIIATSFIELFENFCLSENIDFNKTKR